MKHRAVRRRAAGEMVPSDDALKAFAAAGADDVDALAVGEDRDEDLIARLGGLVSSTGDLHFATDAGRGDVRLLEMTDRRLVRLRRGLFHEGELHGGIAVGLRGLRLDDDTRARLDDGGR